MRRFVLVLLLIVGCQTNPYTGRSQLIVIDHDTEMKMGVQAYQEMLADQPITWDPEYVEPVHRAAMRMSEVAERGWDKIPPPRYQWEVRVVDNPKTVNAWCLPGGKICVYTGIFPAMGDENGLAVVMGHEMMHAILRHGVERVSQGMLAEIGVTVLTEVLGGDDPEKKKQLYGLLGLGAALGILLPYSRTGETEADEFGLYLAAKAGYDPRAGVEVWQRMEQLGGGGTPEFLSTHPSHGTRIENMKKWMPKALEYYEAAEKVPGGPLPGAGAARRVAAPAEYRTVGVENRGCKRVDREGKPAAAFEFALRRPAFIHDVLVEGPVGTTIECKQPLQAGAARVVTIWMQSGNAPPGGTYRITFRGSVNGSEFAEATEYDLD
ncbi:MAG: M48 family metallopeptidase [Planctomycetes bacterium]|nr:M48 family metallopeptidase [Planctomycetota bacterium]